MSLPHIVKLERIGGYRLKLWFSTGEAGEWDFSHLAAEDRPVTKAFQDPAFFDRVYLDFGALTWPNGYDWCPDSLHADMTAAGVLTVERDGLGR